MRKPLLPLQATMLDVDACIGFSRGDMFDGERKPYLRIHGVVKGLSCPMGIYVVRRGVI